MKKLNKNGFTLVELIVVIAMLASILVPSLIGYVRKSKLKTANANAKTAYSAVAAVEADCETKGFPIVWNNPVGRWYCNIDRTSVTLNANCSNYEEVIIYEVTRALNGNGNEAGEVAVNVANINGVDTFFCHWRKYNDDVIFGQYPQAIKNIDQCGNRSNFGFFLNV